MFVRSPVTGDYDPHIRAASTSRIISTFFAKPPVSALEVKAAFYCMLSFWIPLTIKRIEDAFLLAVQDPVAPATGDLDFEAIGWPPVVEWT